MTLATSPDDAAPLPASAPDRHGPAERRDAIIDAFERCLGRSGFHQTSMHDVAREAGMSAGNLYRYFSSKNDLVAGLCARDRERVNAGFDAVIGAPDVMAAFLALGRQHMVDEPRTTCVQLTEIWAEAAHNPEVAELCLGINREIVQKFAVIMDGFRHSGQAAPQVDARAVTDVLTALWDGLCVRRAIDATFDPQHGFALLTAVMAGLLSGTVPLPATPSSTAGPA